MREKWDLFSPTFTYLAVTSTPLPLKLTHQRYLVHPALPRSPRLLVRPHFWEAEMGIHATKYSSFILCTKHFTWCQDVRVSGIDTVLNHTDILLQKTGKIKGVGWQKKIVISTFKETKRVLRYPLV